MHKIAAYESPRLPITPLNSPDSSHSGPGDIDCDEFARLLQDHERRLQAYVFSMVFNWADAADIVQDVTFELWQRFQEFDRNGDFGGWACAVAYYRVLTYRKKKGRRSCELSGATDRMLCEISARVAEETSHRRDAMARCLGRLAEAERNFLQAYYGGTPVSALSEKLARSVASLYKDLASLRRRLRACIDRTLRQEGGMGR